MGAAARDPNFGQSPRPIKPQQIGTSFSESKKPGSTVHDFSIVIGGPVYEFLQRVGLIRLGLPNVLRRVAVFVAIAWLPLLLLSLVEGLAFGHHVQIPLLYDFSVYGRFLLALPLLILAEVVIDPGIRVGVREFVVSGIVQDEGMHEFESMLQNIQRLRDSAIPELVLLVVAFFPTFLFQHEWARGAGSNWHTSAQGLTHAGWWFALISTPILRFLIYRWVFRYAIWSVLLWRVGRLNLRLMPTHPDHAAGLEFLSMTQSRFGILFCALGCAFAGRIANSLLFEHASVASFKFLIGGFVVLSVILGVFPLILLAPKLKNVRKSGLLEYGKLANKYTESFDRKWVHPQQQASEPLLGTSDIQSLADLGNSYTIIKEMDIAPVTKRLTIQLLAQASAPLIPVIVAGTPTPELVHAILKMVA